MLVILPARSGIEKQIQVFRSVKYFGYPVPVEVPRTRSYLWHGQSERSAELERLKTGHTELIYIDSSVECRNVRSILPEGSGFVVKSFYKTIHDILNLPSRSSGLLI